MGKMVKIIFRDKPNWFSPKWIFIDLPSLPLTELIKCLWKNDLGLCSKCGHIACCVTEFHSGHYSNGFGWYSFNAVCQVNGCECVNSEFEKFSR